MTKHGKIPDQDQKATFRGKRICGKRGGYNFLNSTRVDIDNKTCPNGYVPCSNETSPEHTICLPCDQAGREKCPITMLKIVDKTEV